MKVSILIFLGAILCILVDATSATKLNKLRHHDHHKAKSHHQAKVNIVNDANHYYMYESCVKTVAIGAIHVNFNSLVSVLQERTLINAEGSWSGGNACLVVEGDFIDSLATTNWRRSMADELTIFYYLFTLQDQAKTVGGKVIILFGHHEILSLKGDYTFVSAGDWTGYTQTSSANTDMNLCVGSYRKFNELATEFQKSDGRLSGLVRDKMEVDNLKKEGKATFMDTMRVEDFPRQYPRLKEAYSTARNTYVTEFRSRFNTLLQDSAINSKTISDDLTKMGFKVKSFYSYRMDAWTPGSDFMKLLAKRVQLATVINQAVFIPGGLSITFANTYKQKLITFYNWRNGKAVDEDTLLTSLELGINTQIKRIISDADYRNTIDLSLINKIFRLHLNGDLLVKLDAVKERNSKFARSVEYIDQLKQLLTGLYDAATQDREGICWHRPSTDVQTGICPVIGSIQSSADSSVTNVKQLVVTRLDLPTGETSRPASRCSSHTGYSVIPIQTEPVRFIGLVDSQYIQFTKDGDTISAEGGEAPTLSDQSLWRMEQQIRRADLGVFNKFAKTACPNLGN